MKSFAFINDFLAAGYGCSILKKDQYVALNEAGKKYEDNQKKTVKVVIGPGTGLGQGLLIRGMDGGLFEPFPSEGGHTDFAVTSQEDWDLF